VPTTIAALQLARRYTVEMPIAEQMYQVLFEGKDPGRAVIDLMTRDAKGELNGWGTGVRTLDWLADSLPRKSAGRGED
jgi:hypothetical protein